MAIYQRGSGGHVAERVQPEPGSDEDKRLAALADAGEDNWSKVAEEPPAGDGDGGEPKRPAKNAPKDDWVAWAVAQGADEAEAKAAKKDELIEQYGG